MMGQWCFGGSQFEKVLQCCSLATTRLAWLQPGNHTPRNAFGGSLGTYTSLSCASKVLATLCYMCSLHPNIHALVSHLLNKGNVTKPEAQVQPIETPGAHCGSAKGEDKLTWNDHGIHRHACKCKVATKNTPN